MRRALVIAILLLAQRAHAQRVGDEHVVLHTVAGDIVLGFYPDVAPAHTAQLLKLFRLGVYDGVHFYRVEPGFVLQTSVAEDRPRPLSDEQRQAIHPIKLETSSIRHMRGILSMARSNDPDSAETSFSILLGPAPHLDGKYTVFGVVEEGMDVVDELVNVPRDDKRRPLARLSIRSAEVVSTPALAAMRLAEATPIPVAMVPAAAPGPPRPLAAGLALMVTIGAVTVLFARRLPSRYVFSLVCANVLIGAFLLLILLTPAAHASPALAVVLFAGLLGVLKLMGKFESSG